jgi:phosphotriesterase-related protein
VLRAAARVHKKTGVPIITHTDVGTLGGDQLDIFQNEGVDFSRIVIGHTCCSSDIKNYLAIVKRGAYAGFDRIGWELFMAEDVRLVAVAGLIGAGYANRMTLSQDSIAGWAGNPRFNPPAEQLRRVTYLEDDFIPRLLKGGIAQKSIDQILLDNPRHIFGG